jgi:hypothetical protein
MQISTRVGVVQAMAVSLFIYEELHTRSVPGLGWSFLDTVK